MRDKRTPKGVCGEARFNWQTTNNICRNLTDQSGQWPEFNTINSNVGITTAQVVKTSVTLNNSPIEDYIHLEDHIQPT